MLNLSVLHKAPVESLPAIVATGLRRAESNAQTPSELWTNHWLDRRRPAGLAGRGVRRGECIYCYLGINGRVLDVDSGDLVPRDRWLVGPDSVRLCLTTAPGTAFISDLDAYDRVRSALEQDRHHPRLPGLADRYWSRVVDVDTAREHYRLAGESLVADPTGPARLPRELHRVEVLLTADVAPEDIHTATGRALIS